MKALLIKVHTRDAWYGTDYSEEYFASLYGEAQEYTLEELEELEEKIEAFHRYRHKVDPSIDYSLVLLQFPSKPKELEEIFEASLKEHRKALALEEARKKSAAKKAEENRKRKVAASEEKEKKLLKELQEKYLK